MGAELAVSKGSNCKKEQLHSQQTDVTKMFEPVPRRTSRGCQMCVVGVGIKNPNVSGNFRAVLLHLHICFLDMVTFSRVFQLSSYWMVPGPS